MKDEFRMSMDDEAVYFTFWDVVRVLLVSSILIYIVQG